MTARQTSPARPRLTPYDELVNVLEFETEAERVLAADVFRGISGSDRPEALRAHHRGANCRSAAVPRRG
jgi:hypothetical protein